MPSPWIQYARTSDGASIAYWAMGDGRPFVIVLPPGYSNVQFECEVPEIWEMYSTLSRSMPLVRFDFRNCGLSSHGLDGNVDALVRDLEAVVGAGGGGPAALWAGTRASKVALRYASAHPEAMRGLVVQRSTASFVDGPEGSPVNLLVQQMVDMGEPDWFLYSDVFATAVMGLSDPEFTKHFAELIQSSCSTAEFAAAWTVLREPEVESLFPQVKCPVLVLHRRSLLKVSDSSREMAAAMPKARLEFLEGQALHPWEPHVAAAIRDFVREIDSPPQRAPELSGGSIAAGALRTILFTDIEAHTALMQRLGDERGREVLREHERITREALHAHGGAEIKTMGDGFMASFDSAQRAVECAIDLQRHFATRNEKAREPFEIRVGVNAGEPIEEEQDLFGTVVIASSRIAAQAKGGEILVADVVRQLLAGKAFLFSDRGEVVLRGFDDPTRLYEVRWQSA